MHTLARLLALVAIVSGSSAVRAAEQFDASVLLTLEGQVKSLHWGSPNVRFELAVPDGKGGRWTWQVQGADASELARLAWPEDAVKVGADIVAVVHPMVGGARKATLLRVFLADGRSLDATPEARSLVYPPLDPVIVNDKEYRGTDPMAGYYGNTLICKGPSWEWHGWYSPNHQMILFAMDRKPDGTTRLSGIEVTYWLQKLEADAYFFCFIFKNVPRAPLCHNSFGFDKPGAVRTNISPKGEVETLELVPGRR